MLFASCIHHREGSCVHSHCVLDHAPGADVAIRTCSVSFSGGLLSVS